MKRYSKLFVIAFVVVLGLPGCLFKHAVKTSECKSPECKAEAILAKP